MIFVITGIVLILIGAVSGYYASINGMKVLVYFLVGAAFSFGLYAYRKCKELRQNASFKTEAERASRKKKFLRDEIAEDVLILALFLLGFFISYFYFVSRR